MSKKHKKVPTYWWDMVWASEVGKSKRESEDYVYGVMIESDRKDLPVVAIFAGRKNKTLEKQIELAETLIIELDAGRLSL